MGFVTVFQYNKISPPLPMTDNVRQFPNGRMAVARQGQAANAAQWELL